jgi:glycine dehydrogenase subunit 1
MAYVPSTDIDRQKMLDKIGVNSFEELLSNIPESLRFKKTLNLLPQLSEYEVLKLLRDYSNKNKTAFTHTCFLGAGAYDHYVPAIVGAVLQRPEFKTAYTPYQAEVSQGTLQTMYEFQTLICQLTGMEVANASLYDGATSLAEACLMANAHNKKKEVLIAGSLNPLYKKVTETVTVGRELTFKTFMKEDGTADIDALKNAISDYTTAVVVQHPNFYGNLEDVYEIEKIVHETKALFIVVTPAMSLGLIDPPGNYNADVVISEGQSLGIPLNFGGPYLGIFACKEKYVRKIPGRLAGVTKDEDGKRAYVLTLQTREQQIKREKATSNICTNQGLFMLAATVYMETMGKQGIREVAEQSFYKAHYLAEEITKIPGFKLSSDKPFFNEFLLDTPVSASQIVKEGKEKGFQPGFDTERFSCAKKGLLIAVTEKRTKEEMDSFVEFLKQYAS